MSRNPEYDKMYQSALLFSLLILAVNIYNFSMAFFMRMGWTAV